MKVRPGIIWADNTPCIVILPVLTNRDEDSFAFRVVSNDVYTKLRVSKGADIFGEEENVKEYNIMKW